MNAPDSSPRGAVVASGIELDAGEIGALIRHWRLRSELHSRRALTVGAVPDPGLKHYADAELQSAADARARAERWAALLDSVIQGGIQSR